MKQILLVAALAFSSVVFAAVDDRPTLRGPHNVAGTLGFGAGGLTLSAGYEMMVDPALGLGGVIRMFPKETSKTNNAPGIMVLDATASHHFYKKNWDLSFTPGFGIVSIDAVVGKDVTTLGPSFGIGLVYQINSMWAAGFENTRYWAWFNSDYAGYVRDDMSFKVRASF